MMQNDDNSCQASGQLSSTFGALTPLYDRLALSGSNTQPRPALRETD
jgi:hypothetical protein